MLTLLSGGTGTPKLLQGLTEVIPQEDISVIVNTGEDVEVSGLRVSPDLDTVVYTLAGIIDSEKWHGVEGDSFSGHEVLEELGHEEVLRIGDRDRAVQLYRTLRMEEGASLSQATEEICERLGVQANVMPMSDDRIETEIVTEKGKMPFHEFWVVRQAENKVKDVNFLNSEDAEPAPGVIRSLEESDNIIIGPSNPITSLGPILEVEEIRTTLEKNRDKVLAVSPVLGNAPVNGPTKVLMEGLGYTVSPVSVAEIYKEFVSSFILHDEDKSMSSEIEDMGVNVLATDILIPDLSSRVKLAKEILQYLK